MRTAAFLIHVVQDLPALLAPHPLDGAAAVRSVLRHRAEGLEGGAADALLEQVEHVLLVGRGGGIELEKHAGDLPGELRLERYNLSVAWIPSS